MNDKLVKQLIVKEERRQDRTLNLIPSENYVSSGVREALSSVFVNKYSEGYPGARYYGGNVVVDELERFAQTRALRLFGLSAKEWSVNVQPYSGSPANFAIYSALVPKGGKIMGMELSMGGHLTHGHKVSATGKFWQQVPYGVDKDTEQLNYGALVDIARKEKPTVLVVGYTAYPRIIDFKEMRKVADAGGALLVVDMSHIAGLVAGLAYPSPFPYADVVMTTTHKTLRGPRSAVIFSKNTYAQAIDRAVFPGLQGGPHENQIAAMAVAFEEASRPQFKKYAAHIVKNANTLAAECARLGWRLISGGTDTHLMLIDTMEHGVSGAKAEKLLESAGIIVNKNTIPFDDRKPMDPSGIRLGTPALTTRGMKEREMKRIATWIDGVLRGTLKPSAVLKEVEKLAKQFPIP